MAGSKNELYESAMDKLDEFASLGYPEKVRQYACHRVGRKTRHQLWFAIARGINGSSEEALKRRKLPGVAATTDKKVRSEAHRQKDWIIVLP